MLHAPQGFGQELTAVSPAISLAGCEEPEPVDMVVAWPEPNLEAMFRQLLPRMRQDGAIWLVIPKKSSGIPGPSFPASLEAALPLGLVDNKTLTFSAIEYGIRFVIRRQLRKR